MKQTHQFTYQKHILSDNLDFSRFASFENLLGTQLEMEHVILLRADISDSHHVSRYGSFRELPTFKLRLKLTLKNFRGCIVVLMAIKG